jgi:Domain of unknown function (DUF4864)
MRRISRLFVALIGLAAVAPAFADEAPPLAPAERAAIRQTIESQIAAFRRDDGAAAFAFASEELRRRFGSAETFMRMVQTGYQPVYRPSQVTFGAIETVDGAPVQHVLVAGPDGNIVEALYFMKLEADGVWRIDGCLLMKSDLKSS